MAFRPIEECDKGDICSFEICVERSSTKSRITVQMWKREDDKFQVACYDKGDDTFFDKRKYAPDEANSREAYEKSCEKYECLPYPETAAYYKRKGKEWTIKSLGL